MMSSCCTFRLNRRNAFSSGSPSCTRTSAKKIHPQTRQMALLMILELLQLESNFLTYFFEIEFQTFSILPTLPPDCPNSRQFSRPFGNVLRLQPHRINWLQRFCSHDPQLPRARPPIPH